MKRAGEARRVRLKVDFETDRWHLQRIGMLVERKMNRPTDGVVRRSIAIREQDTLRQRTSHHSRGLTITADEAHANHRIVTHRRIVGDDLDDGSEHARPEHVVECGGDVVFACERSRDVAELIVCPTISGQVVCEILALHGQDHTVDDEAVRQPVERTNDLTVRRAAAA